MVSQLEKYKEEVLAKLKEHEVKRASLFGSTLREEITGKSDIEYINRS